MGIVAGIADLFGNLRVTALRVLAAYPLVTFRAFWLHVHGMRRHPAFSYFGNGIVAGYAFDPDSRVRGAGEFHGIDE